MLGPFEQVCAFAESAEGKRKLDEWKSSQV